MKIMQNAHALVVGIASYQHVSSLPPVVGKDAKDLAALLIDPAYCGYPPENVRTLLNGSATSDAIRQEMNRLANRCGNNSTALIYISSHGGSVDSGLHAGEYLLPADADCTSDESLAKTCISGSEFTDCLRKILARRLVVIFDCCHSGGIGQPKHPGAALVKSGLHDSYYQTLQSGRGRVILASSRSDEVSWVLPGASNSLFTGHLLSGLRGGAPTPGNLVRIFDLFHYVQPRVTAARPDQHPIFKAELEDNFPLALAVSGKDSVARATSTHGERPYDVFVSYRQQEPDKSWVRKQLIPRLESEGIRPFVDYKDFRLGAPLIKEIERAVEQSRYTLAVLSPAYLASNFTDLENALAQHLGLEISQRRLICVLREPCKPRLGIRAQLWLDMTDDAEFDSDTIRLTHELRQPSSA